MVIVVQSAVLASHSQTWRTSELQRSVASARAMGWCTPVDHSGASTPSCDWPMQACLVYERARCIYSSCEHRLCLMRHHVKCNRRHCDDDAADADAGAWLQEGVCSHSWHLPQAWHSRCDHGEFACRTTQRSLVPDPLGHLHLQLQRMHHTPGI